MDYLTGADKDFFNFFSQFFANRFGGSSENYRSYNHHLESILSNCGTLQYQTAPIILTLKTHRELEKNAQNFKWDFRTKLALAGVSPVITLYTLGLINALRVGSRKLIVPASTNPIFGGLALGTLFLSTYFAKVASHDNFMKACGNTILSNYEETRVSIEFENDFAQLRKATKNL